MNRDKPDISIKINGKKTVTPQDSRESHNQSQLNDIEPKERVIADWRDKLVSEREHAASHWEAYPHTKKSTSLLEKIQRKKQRPKLLYFFSLAGGAVFLGLFFGIALLHLFTGEETASRAAVDMDDEEAPIISQYSDSFIMHVIQAGAFKEKKTGTEMQDRLKAKGYPAVLTHDGDFYYIFTGIAFDEKGMKQLKMFYEEEGLDVYEKTRAVPEPERKEASGEERELLLLSKQLLFDIEKTMSEAKEGVEPSWSGALKEFLKDTAKWENQNNAYTDLRTALENFKEVEGRNPNNIQELLMETVLYYEEAVHFYNEGKEEKKEKS